MSHELKHRNPRATLTITERPSRGAGDPAFTPTNDQVHDVVNKSVNALTDLSRHATATVESVLGNLDEFGTDNFKEALSDPQWAEFKSILNKAKAIAEEFNERTLPNIPN